MGGGVMEKLNEGRRNGNDYADGICNILAANEAE